MKKIALIALGGTISAKGNNRLDLKDYQSGLLSGKDLLDRIPELQHLAHIEVIDIDHISSTQLTEKHWIHLAKTVEYYLNQQNFDGVVITHGTSTLEETAYFLHLTVRSKKPVVLVGAQRPYTALSSDTPLNLMQAVTVATSSSSYSNGVLVVANDQISSAREVTKEHTYRLGTFQNSEFGFLGVIDGGLNVQFYRKPTRKHTVNSNFHANQLQKLPKVAIVYSHVDAGGDIIQFISRSKQYAGIVVAGVGAGRFSKQEETALLAARKNGIHVVRSSRGGNGRVVPIAAYQQNNFISGDNLTPQKARILLMLALTKTNKLSEIQYYFDTY